jgi:hypothetical protein
MGQPGPKPVDVKELERRAAEWACFFYTLRDGQPGHMDHVKVGRTQSVRSAIKQGLISGNPSGELQKTRIAFNQILEPLVYIPVSEAARVLPGGFAKIKDQDWIIFPPIFPKPQVWIKLKKARTASQIKSAASKIGELNSVFTYPEKPGHEYWGLNPAGVLCRYAQGILIAKQLPHYPKTDRPSSDDKRVEFLAKVMAGLMLGLAPITAVKRLASWHWPKDWAEKRPDDWKWNKQSFRLILEDLQEGKGGAQQ